MVNKDEYVIIMSSPILSGGCEGIKEKEGRHLPNAPANAVGGRAE